MDKQQDKQARGEAFDWRHTQTRVCRFGLLLHQLAVSSFHLAPPNDPDGLPFSPFSEEGPKERVSGVIDADDDGGAPYLHGRPVPAAQVDIVPAFRIQSRDMCNPPTREASEDASWQGEATSVRSDQDGMPRASSAEAKSTLFLFRDLDRSGLGTHVSWLLLASSSSKPSMPLAWECAWPCRRLDSGCLGTVSRPPRTLPFTAHSAECLRSSGSPADSGDSPFLTGAPDWDRQCLAMGGCG